MKNTIFVMKNSLEELNIAKEKIRELEVIAIELPKMKHTEEKILRK